MEWWGWLILGCFLSLVFYVTLRVRGLLHRPYFDLDESEEFSGVINVKANNKVQHDIDIDRLREQFDNDGA